MVEISRRAFVLGGTGVAGLGLATAGLLVNEGVLPGRVRAYDLLGLNGEEASIPDVTPGRRYDGSFDSLVRGGVRTAWSMTVPPDLEPDGLGLLVCLHGARGDHEDAFSRLGVDRFLAREVARDMLPFAVASVDGGATSYWHPRADGTDAAAMVVAELVPMLQRRFRLNDKVALHGWSMGGFGALSMAAAGAPIDAVVATSPALVASYEEAPEGAFDSREDFERHGLRGAAGDFPKDLPRRVDCGNGDPFYFAVRDFVEDLRPRAEGGFEDGAHTFGYMRRVLPDQLAFVSTYLS